VAWFGGQNLSQPDLDGPVNKPDLSTGERGEFVTKNLGIGLNLGVERSSPRDLSSNGRERVARKNLRNVADAGGGQAKTAVNRTERSG